MRKEDTDCSTPVIRDERVGDAGWIRGVNEAAFETPTEAKLVEGLRARGVLAFSLVAELSGALVGHIAFSPVNLRPEAPGVRDMGLGPMAVVPEMQRRGIGSLLVREGLARCRSSGVGYVVVLGHAHYYPRFGFVPASRIGLRCEWEVPDGVFMVVELRTGALSGVTRTVRYEPEFSEV